MEQLFTTNHSMHVCGSFDTNTNFRTKLNWTGVSVNFCVLFGAAS